MGNYVRFCFIIAYRRSLTCLSMFLSSSAGFSSVVFLYTAPAPLSLGSSPIGILVSSSHSFFLFFWSGSISGCATRRFSSKVLILRLCNMSEPNVWGASRDDRFVAVVHAEIVGLSVVGNNLC